MRRTSVKVLTSGGDMLELCHELRSPFVNWVVRNQVLFARSLKLDVVFFFFHLCRHFKKSLIWIAFIAVFIYLKCYDLLYFCPYVVQYLGSVWWVGFHYVFSLALWGIAEKLSLHSHLLFQFSFLFFIKCTSVDEYR